MPLWIGGRGVGTAGGEAGRGWLTFGGGGCGVAGDTRCMGGTEGVLIGWGGGGMNGCGVSAKKRIGDFEALLIGGGTNGMDGAPKLYEGNGLLETAAGGSCQVGQRHVGAG